MKTYIEGFKLWLTKENIKKGLIYLGIIILFFLFINSCNNTTKAEQELIKEKATSELLQMQLNDAKEIHENLVDSLNKSNKKENKIIKKAEKANDKLDKQSQRNKIKKEKKQSQALTYSQIESTNWFNDRYKKVNSAVVADGGVTLKGNTVNQVIDELIEKDYLVEELNNRNKFISNLETQNQSLNVLLTNKTIENESNKALIIQKDELSNSKDNVIETQEEIITKQSRNNKLLKVGVPAAAIGGFILGVLIAK